LNDKNNNDNDIVDFLVDKCEVVRIWEEEVIVFKCVGCSVEILRNSREHDNSKTKNGEDWFCGTCDIPEEEVQCVECSTIVPSSEADLTGTEGWGVCDNCLDEEEEEELSEGDFCGCSKCLAGETEEKIVRRGANKEGEDWCECESDDEYSVSKSGCDNIGCE
jgi:hypothetical protein